LAHDDPDTPPADGPAVVSRRHDAIHDDAGGVMAIGRRARRSTGGLVVVIVVAALAVVGLASVASLLPDLNPFGTETRDRSQPAVLKSLERLSEYRAATANLQVVVDIEEDAKLLPPFIKGERTLLVAAGNVDAVVDFGRLGRDAVTVSRDRREVTVRLPAARLSEAELDLERTRIYDRDRGVLDRIGDLADDEPDRDRALFALAERKLTEAARSDAGIRAAGERNTEQMLVGLLRALGFTRIDVRFAPPGS
jgi:Protein of unknown function (DUF4230)